MTRSTTRFINFRRIGKGGELASTIIRLMMACNDLTIADAGLAAWHEPASRKNRQMGAKMYFVRLQIAHIFEALSIIEEIRKSDELSRAVDFCDARTRSSFEKICSFVGTDDYKRMLRIRNNITFHYGRKVVEKALAAAYADQPETNMTVSMGGSTIDWFFQPADRIIDRIVVRDIFGVEQGADVSEEVDKIVVRLQQVGVNFADFAGYFVWKHTSL